MELLCFGLKRGGSGIGVRFLIGVCFCVARSLVGGVNGQVNLPLFGIEKWAEVFGQTIYEICAKATALSDIRTDYILMEPKVPAVNGENIVEEMKLKMEEMLRQKINAVQRLVKVAERSYSEHIYDKDTTISYHMAKKLNTSEFMLEENEHFNHIEVNLTMSTVHVPTNVYDRSAAVLNGVSWSEALDGTFIKNLEEDPTSTWQYFCSASGFLRNFPGTAWRTEDYVNEKNIDVFDCRVRRWYIQAAAYPKDVVILLDSSGSMKGLRIEIAKATVEKILDTLGDDDFFNVIKYSDSIEYVDSCFNATMVQASENNKKRVKESLSAMKTQNIAYLNLALVEAFELLLATNDSGRGSLCNKAIMIVTDGATDTYEDIFEKYNSPKANVRVFTYLIGREVGDSRNVLWMACRNKGRFSHITSLADVHEHVQSYVHVLSRPLVISRARLPIWTNVYLDTLVPGLELMTTIAQPVFDTKNETANSGVLLGVVGSDVPLKELTKITPPYKLGVNGYSFAITNNGYVLFHPRFKPPLGYLERRGSYAVDISEIELLDEDSKLRNSMVERKRGHLKISSVTPFDQAKRAIIRDNHFYFTDIEGTPFSLAISLPDGYGVNVVEGKKQLYLADLSALRTGDLTIAPWNYCKMANNESRQHPFEMLIKYLNVGKENTQAFAERCDMELVEHLLFDAEATRGALASWMKENHDGTLNDSTSKRNGIEIVFVGTKAGLTRYFKMTDNLTDPDFIQKNNSTIEEVYYTRAVDNGETAFTFSVPFNREKANMSETVLTVSTPIIISEDGREGVAAVVGLQMKFSKFYEVFLNVTRTCPQKGMNCNQTCESDEINCYLLDNNVYVIASKNPKDVGQFFGELEGNGALMRELIFDEDVLTDVERMQQGHISTKKIFRRIKMVDYQAMCDIYNTVGLGASSIFLSPLGRMISAMASIFNELLLFFLQFSLLDWWRGSTSVADDTDGVTLAYDNLPSSTEYMDISTDYGQYYDDLNQSSKDVIEMMRECASYMNDPRLSSTLRMKKFKECLNNIRQKQLPRIIGQRPCVKEHTYYLVDPVNLPVVGEVTRCPDGERCTNHYSANRVPGTNLLLLVVDAVCTCSNERLVSLEPEEIKYNSSYVCQKLQNEVFRKRPKFCHAYHENENSTDCGRCGLLQPSIILTVLLLLVSILPLTHFIVPH